MKPPAVLRVALLAIAISPLHAATIFVTTLNDDGPGSLRDALANTADGDKVDASGISGTITLTSGELLVTNSVDIIGPGPDHLAVNGNAANRVFHIGSNTVVGISGLTITNGVGLAAFPPFGGGGILNDHASLTVSNSTVSGNSGSGIRNDGSGGNANLEVIDSILRGNRSNSRGGGILNDAASGAASVKILDSTFSDNSGGENGGGGICNIPRGGIASVNIVNSTLVGNSAAKGGGICNGVSGSLPSGGTASMEIVNSAVISNSVYGDGGGIFNDGISATLMVVNSIVSSNSAMARLGSGGGIVNSGSATVSNSTVSGNSVAFLGGGIRNGGTMQIVRTTVSGNTSYEVGGIFNTRIMQISDSTISSNSALAPGGIWNRVFAVMQIVNSTLSGNSATAPESFGGGAILNDGTLQVAHSTFSGNSAGTGGGICNFGSATLDVGNTTFKAGATGANIENLSVLGGFVGAVTSHGYNLSSDNGSGLLTGPGDKTNTDPLLGPLQNNGGPTFTHALLPSSPAIDAGDPNFTPPPDFDQRGPGFPRVVCGRIDIGALEVQDTMPPIITCSYNIVTNATSPTGVVVNFPAPSASDNCSVASVSCSPASGSTFAIDTTAVTCRAIDSSGNTNTCAFTIRVKGAAEQISNLIALVNGLSGVKTATKNALIVKLSAAQNALTAGNTALACSNLKDFISLASAQAGKKQITPSQATLLINEATRIRVVLSCP